ncbi:MULTISPECIES: sulfite exporter TauE/SafE family protein [unclassified Ruminococcus]|uniref:sulfite exporter TauE/SafE family protein n=1 Tax=unclassified Ruminococcus TaxID=2608920 RepID=UPI0021098F41|nr:MULTISPECIES: sulfite exporter TauE/SafE family protein [unclassified Ruminococcus]MCQ4021656.1 TSUP family transporter [Ruminococcus sp. zg-924]MCQ4114101.1 TSUP family transporter [Ruminococcus sp. zg-921]
MGRDKTDMEIVWGGAAAFMAGIFSSMGMGGGGIMIIYFGLFTAIPQLTAQGINVLFFIPIAALSVIIYHIKGLIAWRTALPFAVLGVITSLAGSYLATVIDGGLLSKTFGILLLIMGVRQLFSKSKKIEHKKSKDK